MKTEENHIPRYRLAFIALIVFAAMAVLILRLWDVQVSQGETYTTKLHDQTTVAVRLSPARGAILDRNGVALAENQASFDIDFYLDELVRNYSREHRGRVPRIEVPRKIGGRWVTRKEPDVAKIVNEAVEPLSRHLGFPLQLNGSELQRHYYQTPSIPYQYKSNIDFTTLARFSERNLGVPGIDIAARPVRHYNFGALAPHILGYVGEPEDKDRVGADGVELETVGRQGVEHIYDGQLQGSPGGRILRVNSRGYIDREESARPATVGNSLCLTLDARIQTIAEEVMRGVGRGAAVVMDPNNGDILAMVSVPSYDPNDFIPNIPGERWKQLTGDPTAPLLNRATSAYAPGSTFKVLVSLAALKSGAITPNTVIDCPPSIQVGNITFHDHSGLPNGMGAGTIRDALRVSCNVFFYQVGIKTGIQAIDQMGDICGLGQSTGIPLLGESAGVLPGPEWLKKNQPKERWSSAYTANTSIGQGYVLTTPLQMATIISAVANGGTVYYPRLTQGVTNLQGDALVTVPTRVRGELGLKFSDLAALREALLGVVKEGTGRKAALESVEVAGKTGSAQFKRPLDGRQVKDTRAWFYGFAPFKQPRYAFCIMVEGGVAGGATAAPLAHEMLSRIFDLEKTGQFPAMTYLTPAVGNFAGVTELTAADATRIDAAQVTPAAEQDNDANNLTPPGRNKSNSWRSR